MMHFFWVFLFCVSSVMGQGVPDPADLAPDWREYFRNGEGELQQRVTTFREVLDRFAREIEEEETKKDIASLNQEISSYLELLLLTQNGNEEQISTWITKTTYSLKDYLAMADEARELKKGVTNQETELQRLRYRLKEEDQNNSNAYVAYRNLPPQSEEKLLKGLQL
ncbi:MAG: hypothetical protein KDK65_04420, partial [Chlamydiia bacterium]|nr:hypothetical protein [Chlamydiia bacterium]